MKLRNKKTGDIINVDFIYPETAELFYPNFKLVDFNELFEDYEESKESYYIDCDGEIYISNYFETREEAEKAVEKLKAWKRLKDKFNFGFNGIIKDERNGKVLGARLTYTVKQITFQESYQLERDLYVLFGGEE